MTSCAERPGRWVADPAWPSPNVETRCSRWRRERAARVCAGCSSPGWRPASGAATAVRPTCRATSAQRTARRCAGTSSRSTSGSSCSAHAAAVLELRGRPPARARRRSPVRRRARRQLVADRARPAQPHPPRGPRPRRAARPRRVGDGARADAVDRLCGPGRASAPPRGLADLLALGLAVARAGHADGHGRDRSSCPCGARRRRTPSCARSTRRNARPSRRRRRSSSGPTGRTVTRDFAAGAAEHRRSPGSTAARCCTASATELAERNVVALPARRGRPALGRGSCEVAVELARGDWRTRVDVRSAMTCDRERFLVTTELDAYEGETRCFTRRWTHEIARDGG